MPRSLLLACILLSACHRPARDSATKSESPGSNPSVGAQESRAADDDPIDPETGLERSCDFAKVMSHLDPAVLLREQLRRDAAAELTHSQPWFDTAVDCPGHLPGPDAYTLIARYAMGPVTVSGDSAWATVTFWRLGTVWPGTDHFQADTATVRQTVRLWHSPYGWRLRSETFPWLNILLSSAFGLSHADSLRAAQLAVAMPKDGA